MGIQSERRVATWGSFEVDGPDSNGYIRLAQCDRKSFALGSSIVYRGRTGLEDLDGIPPASLEAIRSVGPADLPETDLATVPTFLRWFVSPYGRHTPATLIHDHLIGLETPIEGITPQHADRYFRHMLEDLGIRYLRRWLMWTATAFRTRYDGGLLLRLSLILWVALAGIGTTALVIGLVTSSWLLVLAAVLAPLLGAGLWGHQYGAGLLASYVGVPWIMPPTVFALIFYAIYRLAEYLLGKASSVPKAGSEPIDFQYF